MSSRRHVPAPGILACLIFAVLCQGHAQAQERIRGALLETLRRRATTSPLLDRMFSPGGAAYRNSHRGAWPRYGGGRNTIIGYGLLSDGSPYDPFLAGSFPNRYNEPGSTISRYPNYGAPSPAADFNSANAVDMTAPARLHPLGSLSTPAFGGESLGQFRADAFAPRPAPRAPDIALTAPSSLGDALLQIQKQHRSSAGPDESAAPAVVPQETPSQQPATEPSMHDLLRAGAGALHRGRFVTSRHAYRRAVAAGCSDSRARLGLALAEMAMGNFEKAADQVAADLVQSPNLDRSKLDLRRPFGDPAVFQYVVAKLQTRAETTPSDQALLLLGFVQFYSGQRAAGAHAWNRYAESPSADPLVVRQVQRLTSASRARQ